MTDPFFIYIDLFAGGGGTTQGVEDAVLIADLLYPNGSVEREYRKVAKVVACVNHDQKAIKTHEKNHDHVKHFEEDIRTLDLTELKAILDYYRRLYPTAKIVLGASLPCPHFSKALGNKPKDEGIRTMGKSLYMKYDVQRKIHVRGDSYIQVLDPDYIIIENVEEFKSWGPLDDRGRPISKDNGQDWLKWKQEICKLGYVDDWKELNSADYGAHTSRNRLFGIFAKPGLPIAWPMPTHSKNPVKDMFGELKPWKAVRELIDFNDAGKSIINRKIRLSDNTINGIIKGIKSYALKGEEYFLFHYYGNNFCTSVNTVAPSFRTKQSAYLIQAFIHNPSHGGHCTSIDQPCPVIVARQDKAPLRMVTVVKNKASVSIEETDSPAYKVLKQLMIDNSIEDIFYRPLRTREKLLIQGFPKTYKLEGTQADQEKQIGNSVVPIVAKVIMEALALRLVTYQNEMVA